ncbi:sacsin N-terminal ATP-binding-like domain-containing protein [Tomitella fengzijianii]|uniref:sacsin N-terminal ATP-binding-like domain-containing protein n=1 Tax=Tomitella fengzijianii TaxID=2597660 RepID=UPI0018EF1587|nr:ATP-binding protein [Tomitella fengzijianii]
MATDCTGDHPDDRFDTPDPSDPADPFGVAELRAATLESWRRSPTRLREDAAAEADLRRGGYRDRVFTELAQNAADAAAEAGVPGELTVAVTSGADGDELHVANTGTPLSRAGMVTLCALRASTKSGGVGRFGVGFTAVTALGDQAAIRSRHGGVVFSRERTRAAAAEAGIAEPAEGVPTLRLPWPDPAPPRAGADTEVVIRLRAEVDAGALTESFCAEAPELLLELPALAAITVGDRRWTRDDEIIGVAVEDEPVAAGAVADAESDSEPTPDDRPEGEPDQWRPARTADRQDRPVLRYRRIRDSRGDDATWVESSAPGARWLARVVDGRVVAGAPDVVRAPTRSDEELSLPVLLIVEAPMAPDRRRLMPGTVLSGAASHYPDLMRAVPDDERLRLVPEAGFPRGPVDARLREDLTAVLRTRRWLPTVQGRDVAGGVAVLVPGLTDELAEVLRGTVDALLIPGFSGQRAQTLLAPYGVRILDAAGLADLLTGVERPPSWWRTLYAALEPLAADSAVLDQLGALPVPLADGRTVTGPRTVVVGDGLLPEAGADLNGNGPDDGGAVPVLPWVRLVHPAAAHRLLLRLGAAQTGVGDLLADPALRAAVADELESALTGESPMSDGGRGPDGEGPDGGGGAPAGVSRLVDAVLRLVRVSVAGTATDTADPEPQLPDWIGMLPLPDAGGEPRAADELLAPGAPLAEVLVGDSPFGVLDARVVDAYGIDAIRAVGVGWGFSVVRDEAPTGPDHDLDDEDAWWSGLDGEPETLGAVRDLDLVDPDRWAAALRVLAGDARIRPLLSDRAGYTAWWLRRHAAIGGIPVAALRGDDPTFDGLLDIFPGPDAGDDDLPGLTDDRMSALGEGVLAGGTVDGPMLARTLIDRLADPDRGPGPAVVVHAHRLLEGALEDGAVDLDDVDPPDSVRAVDGGVVAAADALVLDDPWLAAVVPQRRLVVGTVAGASLLADLLDVDLASQAVRSSVTSSGRRSTWAAESGAVVAAAQAGVEVPGGPVLVHEDGLSVRVAVDGEEPREVAVPWWVDDEGAVHTDGAWAVAVSGAAAVRRS